MGESLGKSMKSEAEIRDALGVVRARHYALASTEPESMELIATSNAIAWLEWVLGVGR